MKARIILFLFGIIIPLLCLEAVMRLATSGAKKAPAFAQDRPSRFYIPGGAADLDGNIYPQSKEPGKFRIGVIGDSFTFGQLVQYDDTFPLRLERLLNLTSPDRRFEVINFGVSGLSTVQELAVAQRALAYNPDVLVLEITLNDAQQRQLREEPEEVRAQFGPYVPHGLLAPLVRHMRSLSWVLERIHNAGSKGAYVRYHEDMWNSPELWPRFTDAIGQFHKLCTEHGVKPMVVIFPLFDFKIDEKYPFAEIHQKITAELQRRAIPTLDLQSAYTGMDPYRLQVLPGADSHPNEIAHRIAADALFRFGMNAEIFPVDRARLLTYGARSNIKEKAIKNSNAKNPNGKKKDAADNAAPQAPKKRRRKQPTQPSPA